MKTTLAILSTALFIVACGKKEEPAPAAAAPAAEVAAPAPAPTVTEEKK